MSLTISFNAKIERPICPHCKTEMHIHKHLPETKCLVALVDDHIAYLMAAE